MDVSLSSTTYCVVCSTPQFWACWRTYRSYYGIYFYHYSWLSPLSARTDPFPLQCSLLSLKTRVNKVGWPWATRHPAKAEERTVAKKYTATCGKLCLGGEGRRQCGSTTCTAWQTRIRIYPIYTQVLSVANWFKWIQLCLCTVQLCTKTYKSYTQLWMDFAKNTYQIIT